MSELTGYKREGTCGTWGHVSHRRSSSGIPGKLTALVITAIAFVSLMQTLSVIDAAESPPMKSNVRNLTVAKGTNFTIDLRCAAGRGFSWQLAEMAPTNKVSVLGERFTTETDKDGGDGIQHFDFKASVTGTTTLRFIYVQPFRKPFPKDARTTNIVVTIK